MQQSFADKRRLGASLDNLDAVMQDTVECTHKSLGAPGTWVRQLFSLKLNFFLMLNESHNLHLASPFSCTYGGTLRNSLRLVAYQTLSHLSLAACLGQQMSRVYDLCCGACRKHGFSFLIKAG